MTILVLLVALFFAIFITPIVRQLALRINFVAVPKSDRAHTKITPLMGGLALYIGFAGSLLLLILIVNVASSLVQYDETLPLNEMILVLIYGTAFAATGLWDDWRPIKPLPKLLLQFIPIVALWFTTSIRTSMNVPDLLNFILTVCWFLYTINAFNYMDNMDGIAAMVSTVAGACFTVIAVITGQFFLAAMAAAVAGTSFGFLRYNLFNPHQKIFMGDAGALFLGFLLAVIGLKLSFAAESPWITWPVPVLVFGIPIFDTGLVFISRMRRGKSFLQGGTDHLSHRLSRLGFGRFGVPFAIGLLGSALGCAAIIVMHSTLADSLITQGVVLCLALYLLYKLEFAASYTFRTGQPEKTADTSESSPEPETQKA